MGRDTLRCGVGEGVECLESLPGDRSLHLGWVDSFIDGGSSIL